MGMMTLTTVTINATSGPGVAVELEPNVCVWQIKGITKINYNPQRHLVWSEKLFGSTLFREAPFISLQKHK